MWVNVEGFKLLIGFGSMRLLGLFGDLVVSFFSCIGKGKLKLLLRFIGDVFIFIVFNMEFKGFGLSLR